MAKLVDKERYSSVIKKVVEKELTQKEASLELGITDRQVRRIVANYKDIGESAFIHKSVGRPSNNENMKNAIKENTISEPQKKLFDRRKQEEFEKHIRRSTLHYSFGQEIQMDAAFWNWFGNEDSVLHLAVDKATKKSIIWMV